MRILFLLVKILNSNIKPVVVKKRRNKFIILPVSPLHVNILLYMFVCKRAYMKKKILTLKILVLFFALLFPYCLAEEGIPDPKEWKLEAGSQRQIDDHTFEASGYVNFISGDIQLQADSIRYNRESGEIVAEGNIVLSEKNGMKIAGDRIEMNLEDATGIVYDATAFEEPSYFFRGEKIEKIGENEYVIYKAHFTTCNQPKPYWSFRAAKTKATVGKYAKFKHLRMRIKDVPILYIPYFVWPIKQDRTSGFLIPDIGYSQQKGSMFSTSFFWAISRNADATFEFEYWDKDGVAIGTEFRYKLRGDGEGEFNSHYIEKNTGNSKSYSYDFKHKQKLPGGMDLTFDSVYVNSIDYYRSYESDFDLNSRRTIRSKGMLTKGWANNRLNIIALVEENYRTSTDSVTLKSLPEIEFRGRRRKLFDSPLYLSFDSSAINIRKDWSNFSYEYERYDFSPELSMPLSPFPWLDIDPSVGFRNTYYSKTVDPDSLELVNNSQNRKYFHGEFKLSGPKFYKIWNRSGKDGFFERFKHSIEPVLLYQYSEDVLGGSYPLYDEIDRVGAGRNEVTFSLINRLFGKSKVERLGSFEIASLTLTQRYSFDSYLSSDRFGNKEKYSPITATLRFYPLPNIGGDFRVVYDSLNDEFSSATLSARYESGDIFDANLSWNIYKDVYSGDVRSQQVRAGTGVKFYNEKIKFDMELNYDIERNIIQNQRYRMSYKGQCAGLVLEFVRKELGDYSDNEIMFILELKDVGKLLDI